MFHLCSIARLFASGTHLRRRPKRALLLFGAGASIEYGSPSTKKLTEATERAITADEWMQHTGGDKAFAQIKSDLEKFFHQPEPVNFEHIYHCARELIFMFEPSPGAFDEFRPKLYPFLDRKVGFSKEALQALAKKIVEVIFTKVADSCKKNSKSLDPLTKFIGELRNRYVTRIYTTNYDDFPLQAAPDLYTGFEQAPSAKPKKFQLDEFWSKTDIDSLFHLHGSVHMGFPPPSPGSDFFGELFWFDNRDEALRHSSYSGGEFRRMDGASVPPTAIVTGLDKLSALQQRPLSHYYSVMARDVMLADVIYVIGSGLGDLHLNMWLREARPRKPLPPILFVDYWKGDFLKHVTDDDELKGMEMLHALKIRIGGDYGGTKIGTAWTLSKGRTAAVWDKGFQAFLNAPGELQQVRLLAFEDAVDVARRSPILIGRIRPVGDQAAAGDEVADRVDRRQPVPSRKHDD
jgi:hypothetical protein